MEQRIGEVSLKACPLNANNIGTGASSLVVTVLFLFCFKRERGVSHGQEPMAILREVWKDLDDESKLFYKAQAASHARSQASSPAGAGERPERKMPFDMGDAESPFSARASEEALRSALSLGPEAPLPGVGSWSRRVTQEFKEGVHVGSGDLQVGKIKEHVPCWFLHPGVCRRDRRYSDMVKATRACFACAHHR